MQIPDNVTPFLNGSSFSAGLSLRIAQPESNILGRFEFLESLVSGKKIIHLGCCDHLPLIDHKVKRDMWLHKRLDARASRCLGIDIEEESVSYVREQLGFTDVYCHNIITDDIPMVSETHWDYLIMGEILEHIPEPLAFLSTIRKKFSGKINTLVITVPNGFVWANHRNAMKGIEFINTDHKYTFSPFTLAKLVSMAGFTVASFHFVQDFHYTSSLRRKLRFLYFLLHPRKWWYLHRYPALRETLVMKATF